MTLPTASGFFRAENCPASSAMPQVQRETGDNAWGTAGHGFLQRVPQIGEEPALAATPEWAREKCEQIELDGLPLEPERYLQEVTYAFDVVSGEARVLGLGLGRNYSGARSTELVGTIDVTSSVTENVLHGAPIPGEIIDYKFDGYESHSPAPLVNPQLLFPALCRDRLEGGARTYSLSLVHFRPDGTHWGERSVEVDSFDLDAFALRLRTVVARVHEAEDAAFADKVLDVRRGPWCRYCPALTSCPAVVTMIHAACSDPKATLEQLLAMGRSETDLASRLVAAARAYERLAELKDGLKEVSTALWMFASEHDVVLSDGRIYGSIERPVDSLDGRKTREVLAALHNPDVALAGVELKATKASVERALRGPWAKKLAEHKEAKAQGLDAGKKPTLSSLKDAALSALEKAGGIKTTLKRSVKLHRKIGDEVVIDVEGSSDE